ncbi:hypothetical protein KJ671_01730 [Patescibacteria group bacterium]|nr:hypothetical protein [Patescibacteria group bacterium]
MKIIKNSISQDELLKLAKEGFGDMVKIVVDIEQEIMAVGGELHADEEVILAEQCGSERKNTWGINIYPEKSKKDWLEFDSMVNIKPQYNNCSRGVENVDIQEKIKTIVNKLISR